MWIIEDNIFDEWTRTGTFETEQEARVYLAKLVLNPRLSDCLFRIAEVK